jgi:hypothetical protein
MVFWGSVVRARGGCREHRCLILRGSSIPVELPTFGDRVYRSYRRSQRRWQSTTSKDAMALFAGEPVLGVPSADEGG